MILGTIILIFAIFGVVCLGFVAREYYPIIFYYFGLAKIVWVDDRNDHELKVYRVKNHPDGSKYITVGKYSKRIVKLLENGTTDNSYYTWYEYKGPKL